MKIPAEIKRIIEENKPVDLPFTETSDLYVDLHYDSLSFVNLMLVIEENFSIRFELTEMGECRQIDRLIAVVERKRREEKDD